ncbi:MAG: BatD family protein [Planctomycetota bacterium]
MRRQTMRLCLIGVCFLAGSACTVGAQELSAKAVVEKDEVFVGEPFILQIQVEGDESPPKPDVSGITDFHVQELGGQQNSSQSISIINGQMSKVVHRGYIFNYRLTPKKSGTLNIPSIAVSAGGRKFNTNPVMIAVNEPTEVEDFKFRLELSKTKCYVGEPITLKGVFYFSKEIQSAAFNVPALDNGMAHLYEPATPQDPNKKYYRLLMNNDEAIATLDQGELDGKPYAALRFSKILIPKQAGDMDFSSASAACEALEGYRKRRAPRSVFEDGFFDDFFGRRTGVYKKYVVPPNPLSLHVLPVPTEGQPPGYSGLVGEYRIEASAKPTEVNVGDPITLTIKVSGPPYLDHVELPPLDKQPAFADSFKIPKEIAPGKVESGAKVFTQTIRATTLDVKEIPAIELPYFDVERGQYAVAKTKPIPLTVRETKVVTAQDAEGRDLPAAAKSELVAWTKGIAHNYEDLSVLTDQRAGPAMWLRSSAWLAILGLPPLAYVVLLVTTTVARRRAADPGAVRARRAYRELAKALMEAQRGRREDSHAAALEAMRQYLGCKLRLPPGALTFADAEAALASRHVDDETIQSMDKFFRECEAGRYGGMSAADPAAVIAHAMELGRKLERKLK